MQIRTFLVLFQFIYVQNRVFTSVIFDADSKSEVRFSFRPPLLFELVGKYLL